MWKGAFRWLTQLKIAELFGVQKAAISKHLKNIYSTGELNREATVSKMETVQNEGGRTVVREQEFYNLDVIIAVGYRVNSVMATQFRIWATQVLKTYLPKGYAVNARLAQLEDRVDRRLAKHDERISTLEDKVDFFVQTQTPPIQGVFYDGQLWDLPPLPPNAAVVNAQRGRDPTRNFQLLFPKVMENGILCAERKKEFPYRNLKTTT